MKGGDKSLRCDPRAAMWAILTLAAFPLVAFSMSAFGYSSFVTVLTGAASSICVLIIQGILTRRLWISDSCVQSFLCDPAFGFKLIVLVGIVIFLFQSFIIVGFILNTTYDTNVASFILERQCNRPTDAFFARLCEQKHIRSRIERTDAIQSSLREEASKWLFPNGGFVTCAVRPLLQKTHSNTVTQSTIVRCDRWMVDQQTHLPLQSQSIRAIGMARLVPDLDGRYRVTDWSHDPSSLEWMTIGDTIGPATLDILDIHMNRRSMNDALESETYRRAIEFLSAN